MEHGLENFVCVLARQTGPVPGMALSPTFLFSGSFLFVTIVFFVMGWVSKATVAEAYCHVNHHAEQLVLQVQGAVHTDCLWDSC